MPVSLTFNPDHSRTLDRRVRRIDVHVGSLIVTETDDPILLGAEETREFDDIASLTLYSPVSARVTVTYSDEPEATVPATRGDSGGSGGSYESRTRNELRDLAREREIPGYSRLNKDALIEALRG